MPNHRPTSTSTLRMVAVPHREGILGVHRGGIKLTPEERDQLLADARAGNAVKLTFSAIVYRQPKEPNRNFVRFKPSSLEALAASAVDAPFMRDHEQHDVRARAGTIVASKVVQNNHAPAIEQDIELVKAWAVEGVLDGTIDRFSIGWNSAIGPSCSICKVGMFDWESDCRHWPGDVVATDDGEQTVEMLYSDAVHVETSAVSVPAVAGTGIEEIRAALAAARNPNARKVTKMKKIRERLGLAASVADEDAESAILAMLDNERTRSAAALERAEKAETALQAGTEKDRAASVDALVKRAVDEGRVLQARDVDGKSVEGALATAIRNVAKTDLGAAEALVNTLPQQVPARRTPESGPDRRSGAAAIAEVQRQVNASIGLTDDDHQKFAPKDGPRVLQHQPPERKE